MVDKERWERIRKWVEDGKPKPEGYVPTWAKKAPLPPPSPKKAEWKELPKTKDGRTDQEEFDLMADKDQDDDPSDRGVS